MQTADQTTQGQVAYTRYATLGSRAIAFAADYAIAVLAMIVLVVLMSDAQGSLSSWEQNLIGMVLPMYTLGMYLVYAATAGMIGAKLVIADAKTLQRPSSWRLIIRSAAMIASGMTFGLGFLVGLTNERRRTLQDFIAGTVVLERVAFPDAEKLVVQPGDSVSAQ